MRLNLVNKWALVLQQLDNDGQVLWHGRVTKHGEWGVQLHADGWWPADDLEDGDVSHPCDLVATVLRPDLVTVLLVASCSKVPEYATV